MQEIRGNRISMIFQQPLSSLNPVFRVGDQIAEVFEIHQGVSKDEARKRAVEMLRHGGHPRRQSGGPRPSRTRSPAARPSGS